jgi:hypothetical protein
VLTTLVFKAVSGGQIISDGPYAGDPTYAKAKPGDIRIKDAGITCRINGVETCAWQAPRVEHRFLCSVKFHFSNCQSIEAMSSRCDRNSSDFQG